MVDLVGAPAETLTYDQLAGERLRRGAATCCSTSRRASAAASSSSALAACLDDHHHHDDAAALDHRDHPASGHDDRGSAAGRGPSITVGGDLAAIQYPPDGTIVVDDPVVQPGSDVAFRGGGCPPNEQLQVLFDGRQIGTIVSDGQGNFAGTLHIPRGTRPGITCHRARHGLRAERRHHGDGQPRAHGFVRPTSTFVLVGVAAIVVGLVAVVGARRRRSRGQLALTLDGVTRSRRR